MLEFPFILATTLASIGMNIFSNMEQNEMQKNAQLRDMLP